MADETKIEGNKIDRLYDGKFLAIWHGRVVYENGRIKRFKTENDAWEFLARCDAVGKIIH